MFLLDELFKGTNITERIAAGKSVLAYLNKGKNIVFAATRNIELPHYLEQDYDLYHFTEVIDQEQMVFDYKLKPGNLTTRNAIRLLELHQYPREVTQEAKSLAEFIRATSAHS